MALSGSRTEFLAADALGAASDIQYGRTGGCFVSTRRGLMAAIAVIAALIAVGLLVYYYAPCPSSRKGAEDGSTADLSTDFEEGDGSGASGTPQDAAAFRLPATVRPRYYNLWIQPFLGEGSNSNFTFKGRVAIELFCEGDNPCDSVTLHAKDLTISWDTVTLVKLPEGVSEEETRGKRAVGKKYNSTDKPDAAGTTVSPDAGSVTGSAVGDAANVTVNPADVEAVTKPTEGPVEVASPSAASPAPSGAIPASPAASPAPGSIRLEITDHVVIPEKDTFTLNLGTPLEPGQNYSLDIPFWGNISTKLLGFYRSSYKDKTNNKRWLATTHFEPTYARRAFPCFDEPAMKARFEVHIGRQNSTTSTSNMPLRSSEPIADQPGWLWDHYQVSPIMSTYLVAYMVSNLGSMKSSGGLPHFDVMAREELLPTANYSLDIGERILAFYTEYFNVSYPLPKLTMAAVPDFAAGAMENWGLVLYRESLMLFDPNTSTALSKQSVAEVVAHELAHQWFGNLVTMVWWTDLWLNEGFATYVSYIGVNHVEPTWNMDEVIITEQMHPVLETDSLDSTHRVSVEVYNPSQISEVFDEVSYNKGACLIRMLNHSLTESVFRAGLTVYLNTWKYGNARQDDLWEALTKAATAAAAANDFERLPSGASVKNVMDTWTLQEGYPVVQVIRDYTAGDVTLKQRRFRLAMGKAPASASEAQWHIPISVASGERGGAEDTRPRAWLGPNHASKGLTLKNVTAPGSNTWLLINQQQTGFYRVNYDAANWRLLTQQLMTAPEELPTTTRAQLLSDSFNLARAGLLDYATAFNLTLYLSSEMQLVPWQAAMRALAYIDDLLRNSRAYADFQAYITQLMTPLWKSLGQEPRSNDTLPDRQMRQLALSRLLRAEVPHLMDWAQKLFADWLKSTPPENPIPVDMRFDVYCSAVRHGGVREWSAVQSRFEGADGQPVERNNLLRALMCTRHTHLLVTMLERSLEEGSGIRLQDSVLVWRSVLRNPVASYLAFRYVREHWNDIYNKYNKVSFVFREVLRSSIGGLSTELDYKDVLAFEKVHPGNFTSARRTFQQAVEKLRLKLEWRQQHQKAVTSWLDTFAEPTTTP